MKRRNFFSLTVFGLVILLIFLLFNPLSSSSQAIEKEKKVIKKGVAAAVPDEELEFKNPNKKPYVAPQPYVATPSETEGLETVLDESKTKVIHNDTGENFWAMDGFEFGDDRLVSNLNTDYGVKYKPDVAVDISSTIYVAMEAYYAPSGKNRIAIMKSSDYGKTWSWYFSIYNNDYYLRTPSIAVGEGIESGKRLLVAFIVEETPPKIQVLSMDLDSSSSTILTPPHFDNAYAKPIIKTNSPYFGNWFAYLVAERHYDEGANNINIEYWRSLDGGLTWPNDSDHRKTIYGGGDVSEWRCPDLIQKYPTIFITAYRKDTRTIYMTDNFGTNKQAIATLDNEPSGEVYPRIAGVYGSSTLMIVYLNKYSSDGDDQAYYIYSSNDGTSWSGPWVFSNQSSDARMPVIDAPPNTSGYFHAIYTAGNNVYYQRRPVDLSAYYSSRKLVSDINHASHAYPEKGIAAFHDNAHAFMVWDDYLGGHKIHGDRTYPDDFLGTWTGQGVYFRTERDTWVKLATPATLITTGDLDDDGTDDPIGIWPGQGGVWVKYSSTGTWAYLSTTADWIATGDMNGDGRDDLLGTWTGQGVYYRDSVSGSWVKLATPATKITAGNLDGIGADDLIGIWPGQGGVWVKYSSSGDWELLSSTAQDIAAGDMNGNYRDDLLGTWSGQGVYYRDSMTGDWIKLATPATLITAGDLDSDGSDDLIGIWPGQGGVWAKYSKTGTWAYLSSTADSITAGMMRGGSGSWVTGAGYELVEPVGGEYINEPFGIPGGDLIGLGPGGKDFMPLTEDMNLVPSGKEALIPGPGRPGFTFKTTPNLTPEVKGIMKKK